MTTTQTDLRIERTIDAPIERVFAAWTDPTLMTRWYCPNPEWEVKADTDLREGGAWRVQMGEHPVSGTYTEIDPPRVLAFTWAWEGTGMSPTQVRVELTEVDGGTSLVLTHTGFTGAEQSKEHEGGWTGCLDRLPKAV